MRYTILAALAAFILGACDQGVQPLPAKEPEPSFPRPEWVTDSFIDYDSLHILYQHHHDTIRVSLSYSQYWHDDHPEAPSGGGWILTTLYGDTLDWHEW